MKMPTTYTKTCIRQYCRYHTEWPKEAYLPAQFQGVQNGHVDASQDTAGVRRASDVAQQRQYLADDGLRPADGQQKGSGPAHQQELRPVEDQLGDVGDRSRILKFPTHHQDPSMEYTSNEGKGVYLHTLVDRERKRSSERG